jgi:arsenite methyltransferase
MSEPTTSADPFDAKQVVKERYATLATDGGSCCGASAESQAYVQALYSEDQLASLPSEVRDMALGCGNPTALANLQPGMVVVDLGAGGGIDAILAALRVGTEGRVIGVDMTPEMVAKATENAAKAGLANVEFRLGEIEQLPIEDAVADVVISNCVINLSAEKHRVFAEAFRVLRPGGMLAVSDMVLLRELPAAVASDPAAWSSCIAGAVPLAEYLDLIERAGFMKPVVRELATYSAEQLCAFKEVDQELFGAEASLSPKQVAGLDGALASAKIVALKVQTCCC